MRKPDYHILLCSSARMAGEPKGGCHRKGAVDLVQYVEEGVMERDLGNVLVTHTGCLKLCDEGPVMVIYPDGSWYGGLDEIAVDQILDALAEGRQAEERLLGPPADCR